MKKTAAVLIACHNRKPTTLKCLETLYSQTLPADIKLKTYLVDAGSTDGTALAVEKHFPEVNIIKGTGSLYWGGSLYLASELSYDAGHDFHIWLNDDSCLYPDSINKAINLYNTLQEKEQFPPIIVGSFKDPDTGKLTFGGFRRHSWYRPLKLVHVNPSKAPVVCDTFNGNFVLISKEVIDKNGLPEKAFIHNKCDVDYGLRAKNLGIKTIIMPGYAGTCSLDIRKNPYRNSADIVSHIRYLGTNVKELPFKEWFLFAQRHGGPLWIIYFCAPYIKRSISGLFSRFLKRSCA